MASGPKTRARVLTIQHPGFSDTLEAVVKRSFSEARKRKNKPEPSIFEGANSPLAGVESYDPRKVNFRDIKKERELRKPYRSPPAGYPESVKDRLAAADNSGVPSEYPLPGAGPYARRESKVMVPVPVRAPVPKARPAGLGARKANETVVFKTPRGSGESVVYKTPAKSSGSKSVSSAPKKTAPKRQRFNDAFASAKKQGKRTFVFEGRRFSTKTK